MNQKSDLYEHTDLIHTATLLPSCFLSLQEAAAARGVRGGVCEVVSSQREGVGGHSLPLCHAGTGRLGRDRRPNQSHQGQNLGGAEEDGVGGAGPPVDTHQDKQQDKHFLTNTRHLYLSSHKCVMYLKLCVWQLDKLIKNF